MFYTNSISVINRRVYNNKYLKQCITDAHAEKSKTHGDKTSLMKGKKREKKSCFIEDIAFL